MYLIILVTDGGEFTWRVTKIEYRNSFWWLVIMSNPEIPVLLSSYHGAANQ
jgi:hypothetical protein